MSTNISLSPLFPVTTGPWFWRSAHLAEKGNDALRNRLIANLRIGDLREASLVLNETAWRKREEAVAS